MLVLRSAERCFGGHSGGETPGLIPNPEAKPSSADGTALGRVWESRTPPDSTYSRGPSPDGVGPRLLLCVRGRVAWYGRSGVRLGFDTFQVVYSLFKALIFGITIAFICAYEGYITEAGAEGVGRSTAKAVVITSGTILALDALTAGVLAPFLLG